LHVLELMTGALAAAALTPLTFDEAYYWMWSQHLAGGYYDHPPMVAWVITLGTTLFGDTPLGVRFATIMLWIATASLLFLTGRMWFGRRVALLATLLFTLLPISYFGLGVKEGAFLYFFGRAGLA